MSRRLLIVLALVVSLVFALSLGTAAQGPEPAIPTDETINQGAPVAGDAAAPDSVSVPALAL